MKKLKCLTLLFAAMLLITGCTKKYNSVEEYENVMQEVRKGNNSYILEIEQKTPDKSVYSKVTTKNSIWKAENSQNSGETYVQTTIFDGKDMITWSEDSTKAMVLPIANMEGGEILNYFANPATMLINWESALFKVSENTQEEEEPVFVKNTEKNGFKCRLIKFDKNREACVNDKLGIAAYHRIAFEQNGKQNFIEANLIKVDNKTQIPDSAFDLPEGITKMNMGNMFESFLK